MEDYELLISSKALSKVINRMLRPPWPEDEWFGLRYDLDINLCIEDGMTRADIYLVRAGKTESEPICRLL